MEELEGMLSELRQALGQLTFYYLDRLKTKLSDEDAVAYLLEEIQKIEGLFSHSTGPSVSLFESLDSLQTKWNQVSIQAAKEKDYSTQFEAEDVLKAIRTVRVALKENV